MADLPRGMHFDPSQIPATLMEPSMEAGQSSVRPHKPGPKRMVGRRITQDCWGCGRPWPCDGSWQARAEAAEVKLAAIERQCSRVAEAMRRQTGVPLAQADVMVDGRYILDILWEGRAYPSGGEEAE